LIVGSDVERQRQVNSVEIAAGQNDLPGRKPNWLLIKNAGVPSSASQPVR
jgi:hypothetical protein